MKLVRFLGVCIFLTALFEVQLLAQVRNRVANAKASQSEASCPNESGRRIWIRVKGEEEFGAILLQIDNEYINYCLGRREHVERVSNIQTLYFDSKPIVIYVPARDESTAKKTEDISTPRPTGNDPIPANIKSPLRLRHKTLSGAVKLRVELKGDNKVGRVTVLESTGTVLDELAVAAAKGLEFVPETRGGNFVTTEKDVIITFFAETPAAKTSTTTSAPTSTTVSKKAELPEPLWPKGYDQVPRSTTQLSWKPVTGAVAYKIRIMYSPDGGNRWERYRDKSISGQTATFDLPFLGNGAVKWMVEVEREDGTEIEGWWAHFAYGKK